MPKRILSISYDTALLETRRLVLEGAGYEVTSAWSFKPAFELCKSHDFDLVIVGHSIPVNDKASMLAAVRRNSNVPVLSIRKEMEEPLRGADASVFGLEGPKVLLEAVKEALEQAPKKSVASTNGHPKQSANGK